MNGTAVTEKMPVSDTKPVNDPLAPIRKMVSACIQCGTCTASCPIAFAMDKTPRHMWRLVLMGEKDAIFNSKTFILCSSCYYCTLRCPRGLPLTDAMHALKQVAARENLARFRQSTLFYKKFIESVRRHGRVREMEFMTLYFSALRNPLVPFRFAGLGMKLMRKGKVALQAPTGGTAPLEKIFQKVAELETWET
jgi:heterodisulfide reductase subunit C